MGLATLFYSRENCFIERTQKKKNKNFIRKVLFLSIKKKKKLLKRQNKKRNFCNFFFSKTLLNYIIEILNLK